MRLASTVKWMSGETCCTCDSKEAFNSNTVLRTWLNILLDMRDIENLHSCENGFEKTMAGQRAGELSAICEERGSASNGV